MPEVNSPTTADDLTKDEYIFLREEMRHEDNLINARLPGLLIPNRSYSARLQSP